MLTAPQGRLSLTSGAPITTGDVTAASSINWVGTGGYFVPLFDGTATAMVSTGGDLSLPLDGDSSHTGYHQAGKNFFSVLTLDGTSVRLCTTPPWATDSSPGTGAGTPEIEMKDGFPTNKNAIQLRYGTNSGDIISAGPNQALIVGGFRTTADGTTEDSQTKRFLSNAYNATWRKLRRSDTSTTPLTYSVMAWQQFLGNPANQVEVFECMTGRRIGLTAKANGLNSTSTPQLFIVSIGRDSTNTPLGGILTVRGVATNTLMQSVPHCFLEEYVPLGYHKYVWLHFGAGADTQSWFTDSENGLSGGLDN